MKKAFVFVKGQIVSINVRQETINKNDYKAVAAVINLKATEAHKVVINVCETSEVKSPIIIDDGITKVPLHLFDLQTLLSTNGLSNPETLKGQGAGKTFKAVYDLREAGDTNTSEDKNEFEVSIAHCALNFIECDLTALGMNDNLVTFQKQAMSDYVQAMFKTQPVVAPVKKIGEPVDETDETDETDEIDDAVEETVETVAPVKKIVAPGKKKQKVEQTDDFTITTK